MAAWGTAAQPEEQGATAVLSQFQASSVASIQLQNSHVIFHSLRSRAVLSLLSEGGG